MKHRLFHFVALMSVLLCVGDVCAVGVEQGADRNAHWALWVTNDSATAAQRTTVGGVAGRGATGSLLPVSRKDRCTCVGTRALAGKPPVAPGEPPVAPREPPVAPRKPRVAPAHL